MIANIAASKRGNVLTMKHFGTLKEGEPVTKEVRESRGGSSVGTMGLCPPEKGRRKNKIKSASWIRHYMGRMTSCTMTRSHRRSSPLLVSCSRSLGRLLGCGVTGSSQRQLELIELEPRLSSSWVASLEIWGSLLTAISDFYRIV
jgi:hypothetical protein